MTSRKATHPVEALIPTTTRDPLVVVPIGEEDLVRNTQQQKMVSLKTYLEEGIQESLKGTHFLEGDQILHKLVGFKMTEFDSYFWGGMKPSTSADI